MKILKNLWNKIEDYLIPVNSIRFDMPVLFKTDNDKDTLEITSVVKTKDVVSPEGFVIHQYVKSNRYEILLPKGYKIVKEDK
jgi:hypothetical protein